MATQQDLEGKQPSNIAEQPGSEIDEKLPTPSFNDDAFGNEEFAQVKYKVLRWW